MHLLHVSKCMLLLQGGALPRKYIYLERLGKLFIKKLLEVPPLWINSVYQLGKDEPPGMCMVDAALATWIARIDRPSSAVFNFPCHSAVLYVLGGDFEVATRVPASAGAREKGQASVMAHEISNSDILLPMLPKRWPVLCDGAFVREQSSLHKKCNAERLYVFTCRKYALKRVPVIASRTAMCGPPSQINYSATICIHAELRAKF
mmetsp:Transcript_18145/g.33529  ORF Transcript_18145/g.33529 Transcript_18145/m.33529 type:complete len:205 (-) Transcript_18145:728-1342(-)